MTDNARHPTKRVWNPKPLLPILPNHTALMMIDLQYVDAHPDYGTMAVARERGLLDNYKYYLDRLQGQVLPNVQRLQAAFRERTMELVHVHIESLTLDGRDRGISYKRLGITAPRGSRDAEFLPEIAPQGDEIVISKTTASPFNSSVIDYVLRNVGIEQIVLTGVMGSGCVESTARDATDHGYDVILVTDACAARTAEMDQKTCDALGGTIVHLKTTDEVVAMLAEVPMKKVAGNGMPMTRKE